MVKGNWLNVSHFEGEIFTDPFTKELTIKRRVVGGLGRNRDNIRDFGEVKAGWNVLGDKDEVLEA